MRGEARLISIRMSQSLEFNLLDALPDEDPDATLAFERERQIALDRYGIIGTGREQAYDDLASVARTVCGTRCASITLVDGDLQWFKSHAGCSRPEMPLAVAFCDHTLQRPGTITEVRDAASDPRFADDSLVLGEPGVRFYAGTSIQSVDGYPLGTLFVYDTVPRILSESQRESLAALARQVEHLLELRRYINAQRLQLEHRDRDQAELQRRHDDLRHESLHDPLTGLLNRAALQDMLGRPEVLKKLDGSDYVLAVADIDHFKRINDTLGHLQGDDVLRAVAGVIRNVIRQGDLAVRFGGEEILIIFPHTTLSGAREVSERIRLAVGALALPARVTISIGLAVGDPAGDEPLEVFRRADQALYVAKANGRNQIAIDGESP